MTKDELRFVVMLAKQVNQVTELQIATMKNVIRSADLRALVAVMRTKADNLTDEVEAARMRSELADLERDLNTKESEDRKILLDAIARMESGMDMANAGLEGLKRTFEL